MIIVGSLELFCAEQRVRDEAVFIDEVSYAERIFSINRYVKSIKDVKDFAK